MEKWFLLFMFISTSHSDDRRPLRFAALVPEYSVDKGCINASIHMAFEDVNKATNLLKVKGKNIQFKVVPVIRAVGETTISLIDALFNLYVKNKIPVVGTIGPPFKKQNELGMHFMQGYFELQGSYSEAHEPVEDYFAVFFKNTPSIITRFDAARRLIDNYNWTRVGILYDLSDKTYRKNVDSLRKAMDTSIGNNNSLNILLYDSIWSEPPSYPVSNEMRKLQEQGARIILALVSVPGARKLFCEAYLRQMYSPKVTWILFETLPSDWASSKYDSIVDEFTNQKTREISCNEDELLIAAYGYISITKQKVRRDKERTISNMTGNDFVKRLHDHLDVGVKCPDNTAYAYDMVWTMTLLYDDAFASGRIRNNDIDFENDNALKRARRLYTLLRDLPRIKFQGITGPVCYQRVFNDKSDRIGQLSLFSNKDTSVIIGMDDFTQKNLTMIPEATSILFKNGNVPKDKAIYLTKFAHFAKPLLVTMWIIACIGILLAISFLIITLIFAQDKNISMQSPAINCVIIFGSVLCYSSVIIYGLDTRFTSKENTHYICWSFLFTLSTGFTLTFGSLFAKAWHIYKLYMTPEVKLQRSMKSSSDWSLFAIIGLFIFIDSIALINWVEFSPFDYDIRNITQEEDLFADTIEIEQIVGCSCEYETQFTIGMYCYKGVILIFGIFLAWQSRNAKIRMQNESKQIAMAIYNVVAVSVIGVICVSVLANTTRHHATYAIVAVCICICTTTTLLLVFIPKVRMILNATEVNFNSGGSDQSSANEPEDNYPMGYVNRNMEKDSDNMKSAFSTCTMTSDVSSDQPCGSLDSSSFAGGSNTSNNAFLSNSVFNSPPSYNEEPKRYVDSNGCLASGVYVGTIDEEPEGSNTVNDSSA